MGQGTRTRKTAGDRAQSYRGAVVKRLTNVPKVTGSIPILSSYFSPSSLSTHEFILLKCDFVMNLRFRNLFSSYFKSLVDYL